MAFHPRSGLLPSITIASLGLAGGTLIHAWSRAEERVVLMPPRVELVEDPLEPVIVKVNLQLWNRDSRPIRVTRASASCGCMGLVTRGNVPLTSPVEAPPGGTLPWQVAIATQNRVGRQSYQVRIEYLTAGGRTERVEAAVNLNVRAGLRAEPLGLVLHDIEPGIEQTHMLDIYDSYPDPGIRLAGVTSSAPSVLRAELVPVRSSTEGGALDYATSAKLKLRRRLRVTLAPTEVTPLTEESLTLRPEDPEAEPLLVPVVYSTARPAYAVAPRSLTLIAKADGRVVRRVRCRLAEGVAPDLRVLRAPDFATVTIADAEEPRTKSITIELDSAAARPGEITFGTEGGTQPVFTLPIHTVSP